MKPLKEIEVTLEENEIHDINGHPVLNGVTGMDLIVRDGKLILTHEYSTPEEIRKLTGLDLSSVGSILAYIKIAAFSDKAKAEEAFIEMDEEWYLEDLTAVTEYVVDGTPYYVVVGYDVHW